MKETLETIRKLNPLVHCITNYVTVNDCANLLLSCGASPIMADDEREAEEITSICSSLVLNIGTLNSRTVKSMFLAGRRAKALHHPVILDPVGAGASALRTSAAAELLKELQPEILRCNISELKMLMNSGSVSRGVDASTLDQVTEKNIRNNAELLREFARKNNCVTAVSGAIDIVAAPDGRVGAIRNGRPLMAKVTGSGCMLTALTAACAGVEKDGFRAACAAFCAMGVAGEIAASRLLPGEGNATYRNRMIDAFTGADYAQWEEFVRYEML